MMTLTELHRQLNTLAAQSLHPSNSIKLLAASKQQSIEKILALYHQGQRVFGENYVQEALPKIIALKDTPIEWHFIGQIQRNKTSEIAQYFAWVHSIDRCIVAERLNTQRPGHLPPLQICIEINETKHGKKSGISLLELPALVACLQSLPRLQWRGLMTMVTEDYVKTANYFRILQKQGYAIDTLSMGMSQDYPQAIACGANLIRLGTALFGERKQHE
jgi:pyridoxal phosphate enzyme (YggS family)